jgi:hypothetical protein
MKSEEWKSYRTRFLVNAKQLNSSLSFVDHLGRQHRGRKGDYLVESSDGVISIAPRRIFEDIYVLMPAQRGSGSAETIVDMERTIRTTTLGERRINADIDHPHFEALEVQETMLRKPSTGRRPMNLAKAVGPGHATRTQRKMPQPCRDGRSSSASRIGLM